MFVSLSADIYSEAMLTGKTDSTPVVAAVGIVTGVFGNIEKSMIVRSL